MYTHCRQFPHLQGRSDAEILGIVRQALDRRPLCRIAIRVRNFAVLGLLLLVLFLNRHAEYRQLGLSLMLAGVATTLFVLAWNLAWVNLVLFNLTKQEI